jgi:alpha-tubulin suppressor-like RCC1 family protein
VFALLACQGDAVVGGRFDAATDDLVADDRAVDAPDVFDAFDAPDITAKDVADEADAGPPPDTGPPRCTSDEQCSGGGTGQPYCDPIVGRCVRCVPGERDRCPASQHCDPMTYECAPGCRSDEGCAAPADGGGAPDGGASATRCDRAMNRCVECVTDDHCPAGNVCAGNRCVRGCDATRACPSGETCCGGGCVDVSSNTGNCGMCGRGCAFANAEPACRAGTCGVGRCNDGYADCDTNAANGCETSVTTDLANCGMCGRACPSPPAATPACRAGACGIGVCAGGFGDCDGDPMNGCETDTRTTAAHCGACGRQCPPVANAEPTCAMGTCGFACQPGFGDCDMDPSNGCEVDLGTSAAHCGACGTACASLANATVACMSGRCAVGTCAAGFADCDRLAANGCEVDTRTSPSHCGGCGMQCPVGQVCTAGTCTIPCPPGQARCGATCTNTDNDPTNCGRCGNACATGSFCGGGMCVGTCSAGQVVCSGACVTAATDNIHCGACGNRCDAGYQCMAGSCVLTCPAGTTSCNRTCANLLTDNANCGRCGGACSAAERCVAGVCTLVCPDPQVACAGLCVDLSRDPNHCGACGTLCPTGCVAGRCASIVDIEAAQNNNCALYASGRVYCWGYNGGINRSGGSFGHNPAPVQVVSAVGAPLENVAQLAGGSNYMCARRTNGTVQCWGASLAVGDVAGLADATHVSARGTAFCAVSGGRVVCWNTNLTPGAAVANLSDATMVAVGVGFNCALRMTGGVVCWGTNAYGQLGNSTTTSSTTNPVAVTGLTDAVSVTAGEHFACARRRTGAVVCWGRNQSGQLGDGSTVANRSAPVEVMSLTGVTELRAGMRHACAIATGGQLRCWGENTYAQLGDATNTNRAAPVVVADLSPQRAVALDLHHTCGLGADGRVRCWGNNPYGEGGGGTEVRSTPAAITGVADAVDVQQGTGSNAATGAGTSWRCALRRTGAVACWGSASQGNSSGQLGDGTTTQRATPAPVTGLTDATQITVAGSVACALKRDQTAVCWGLNNYGQLGDGTTTNRNAPTPVMGLTSVAHIQTGGNHTCARRTDGSVWCWGYNFHGELGQNDQVNRSAPTQVMGLGTNAQELWVGSNFACARLSAGQVHCWGRNIENQLGDGSNTNRYVPVTTTASTATMPVALTDVTALPFCGPSHCVARTANAVWEWGYNYGGLRARTSTAWASFVSFSTNYGYGTCSVRSASGVVSTVCSNYGEFGLIGAGTTPYSGSGTVTGGDRFTTVRVSPNAYGPTCAIDTAGQLYCWGWTGDGSLVAAGLTGITRMPAVITLP